MLRTLKMKSMAVRLPIIIGAGLVMSLTLHAPVISKSPIQVAQSSARGQSDSQQLKTNQDLWKKQKISSYRYTLSNGCFCTPESRGPVIIEVRNGRTTSVTSVATGQPVDPELFQRYDTVPRLFDLIKDAIKRKADNLDVKYNSTLGYPTQINIDYSFQIADEEQYLTIENLQQIY
jgi:hypothetical protein